MLSPHSARPAALARTDQRPRPFRSFCSAVGRPCRRLDSCHNLARPGGNVTGLSVLATELGRANGCEILEEIVPNDVSPWVVLWNRHQSLHGALCSSVPRCGSPIGLRRSSPSRMHDLISFRRPLLQPMRKWSGRSISHARSTPSRASTASASWISQAPTAFAGHL